MMKSFPHYLLLLYLFIACDPFVPEFPAGEIEGFKPIYDEEAYDIRLLEPQAINNAGRLYLYGNLLLINEIGKGIHIIDNADPANPLKLAFINVPGSHDMVIKGDIIYANNHKDLVALKITEDQQIVVTERIKDNIIEVSNHHPQERGFYFECADPSKGEVIGWQKALLNNPECYR